MFGDVQSQVVDFFQFLEVWSWQVWDESLNFQTGILIWESVDEGY